MAGKWYYCDLTNSVYSLNTGKSIEYCLLSKEEFVNRKVARGSTCLKETITDAENTFNEFQLSNNDIDDETMLSYALKLKNIF